MSEAKPDLLRVPAFEADVVRLFALDAAEAARFRRRSVSRRHAEFLASCLGVQHVAPDYVALIDLADLGEQGLEDYLVEGQGIAPQSLFGDLAVVAGLKGHVLVVTSPAFGGDAVILTPQSGLKPVAAWHREGAQPPRLMLPAGARPPLNTRQPGYRFGFAAPWMAALLLALVCGAFALRYAL